VAGYCLDMRADPNIREFVAGVSNEYGPPEHHVYIRVSKDAGNTWSRSVLLPSSACMRCGATIPPWSARTGVA
jgi:hypothetical protein